jgi:choline dehydrogenase-like flavoprotein
MSLAPRERATLHRACEAIVPALDLQAGDDPELFRASAASQGSFALIDEIIDNQSASQVRELGWLLRLFEWPLFVFVLIGRWRRFSALSQLEREQVLLALARNQLPLLRKGFQAIKRMSCFAFYADDPASARPVWTGIGYTPSPNSPARAARLPVQAPVADVLTCDACVIGSGAGGGVMAAELAAAGWRVIVLEAAAALQADAFDQREVVGMRSLYLQRGLLATHDLSTMIVAGSALGGGTAVNWQSCFRTPDDVRAEWAERSGCSFFQEPAFSSALDAVCARLSVGTAESPVNANNDALRRGCEALGYSWSVIPRNSRGCDFAQCGYCMFGCREGGKQSTTVTYLHDAVATGKTTVVCDCKVEGIDWTAGRVTGVTARYGDRILTIRANTVVLAAGSIESPALLLRSGLTLPALGRHLHVHPTTSIAGFYDQTIHPWSGVPQSIVCDGFTPVSDGYGFRLETAPAHPGLFALALPWQGARHHRELMQRFQNACAIIALTRDHGGGSVTLTPHGGTHVEYVLGDRELDYLRRGIIAAARVHVAAGADRVVTTGSEPLEWRTGDSIDDFCENVWRARLDRNWSPVFTAHQLGTCRMGQNPETAVCDENGEVFGVKGLYVGDASAFPGSCGVNPMITIMALAYHVAQRIKAGAAASRHAAARSPSS